jgi:hypothetical protein
MNLISLKWQFFILWIFIHNNIFTLPLANNCDQVVKILQPHFNFNLCKFYNMGLLHVMHEF